MSVIMKMLVCVMAVTALSDLASAIECYECDTATNSGPCGDEDFTSKSTITEVVPGVACQHCSKSKGQVDGATVISRGCSGTVIEPLKANECISDSEGGISYDVCLCSENLCNGVAAMAGSVGFVMAIAIIKLVW